MKKQETPPGQIEQEQAPFFKSWKNMYYFVFGQLIILIFLLYLFTSYFS